MLGPNSSSKRTELPSDSGFKLSPGNEMVLQVHYRYSSNKPDWTTVGIEFTDEVKEKELDTLVFFTSRFMPPRRVSKQKSKTYLDYLCVVKTAPHITTNIQKFFPPQAYKHLLLQCIKNPIFSISLHRVYY